MRLALASINPTIGDLEGNAALAGERIAKAHAEGCDLVVLPELCICGYPPKDLLLQEGFVTACGLAAHSVATSAPPDLTIILGCPLPAAMPGASGVTNSLLAYRSGELIARYDKRLLPTYDVFDEDRYFIAGDRPVVVDVPLRSGGVGRVGLSICEDLWKGIDAGFASRYLTAADPIQELAALGVDVIVSPSASPFVLGKQGRHRDICAAHARGKNIPIASVNQSGANDELVFDGHAMLFGSEGELCAAAEMFSGVTLVVDLPFSLPSRVAPAERVVGDFISNERLMFLALTTGIRDYLRKTGHKEALVGLSGGIDSALTAALAVHALGPANVTGVAMPGPFSSRHALEDALDLAQRLGAACLTVPINQSFDAMKPGISAALKALNALPLGASTPDVAQENLQSRLRGTTIMALSNRTGAMVLTTGNKSELAVGYCTLYGDMNGGLGVLADVSKQWVYRLSRWINEHHGAVGFATPPIPQRTLTKAPSAELRPDQTDQDTLPPYDVLDDILERYVEGRQGADRIIREGGHDALMVRKVIRMVDLAEFKRKQMAVGLKVTTVAFGTGRRFPIARKILPPL